MKEQKYYMFNYRTGDYWCTDNPGYTRDIKKAAVYGRPAAIGNALRHIVPIPVEDIRDDRRGTKVLYV